MKLLKGRDLERAQARLARYGKGGGAHARRLRARVEASMAVEAPVPVEPVVKAKKAAPKRKKATTKKAGTDSEK